MVAVIALLYGWDSRSDQVKTVAMLSFLGTKSAEAVRIAGLQVGTKVTANAFKKLPGKMLIAINKAVGFRLVTKAGKTGVVNLIKVVPIIGGLVSGGLSATSTKMIGAAASHMLREGPGHDGHDKLGASLTVPPSIPDQPST